MAFPRSPTVTAMGAWDIHAASDGRFHLGLGAQVKQHNEPRFGISWTAPAPRMRDYVGATRALWRCWEETEPLNYISDNHKLTLMTPNFMPEPSGLQPPPLSIAAVGPAMLRLAGEMCDGARLHPFMTAKYLTEVSRVEITEGLRRGARDRSELEIVADTLIATGPDQDAVRKMREYIRYRIAFYASTPAYWPVLSAHGLDELGKKLIEYPRADRWSEMAAQIPDELIDLVAVSGTWDTIADRIEERYAGHVDTIYLPIDHDLPIDEHRLARVVERVQHIQCEFKGYRDDWALRAPPLAS